MKEVVSPQRVNLYITHHCNLSCPFCYYRSFQKEERRDLTEREWLDLIDELGTLGVMEVALWGGEPFIRPDILRIIQRIVDNRMRFSMISNGTLLTEEHVTAVAATGRCDYIQLSVDGVREDHDAVRGAGSWEKTIAALKLLKRFRINARVNMVAHRNNFRRLGEAVAYLDEIGVQAIRVNAVLEYPDAPLAAGMEQLSQDELIRMMRTLDGIAGKGSALVKNSGILKLYYSILEPEAVSAERPCARCAMPWLMLTVRADGAILPCPDAGEQVLGWINRDRIERIWHNSAPLQDFRNRIAGGGEPGCGEKNCRYAWYCRRNCPAHLEEKAHICRKKLAERLELG